MLLGNGLLRGLGLFGLFRLGFGKGGNVACRLGFGDFGDPVAQEGFAHAGRKIALLEAVDRARPDYDADDDQAGCGGCADGQSNGRKGTGQWSLR